MTFAAVSFKHKHFQSLQLGTSLHKTLKHINTIHYTTAAHSASQGHKKLSSWFFNKHFNTTTQKWPRRDYFHLLSLFQGYCSLHWKQVCVSIYWSQFQRQIIGTFESRHFLDIVFFYIWRSSRRWSRKYRIFAHTSTAFESIRLSSHLL